METKNNVLLPFMISIPREIRDNLRKLAATRNLENPDDVTSAAQIARKIIIENLTTTTNQGETTNE